MLQKFAAIVVRINNANLILKRSGRTVTEAIACRDTLSERHALITHAIQSTIKKPDSEK